LTVAIRTRWRIVRAGDFLDGNYLSTDMRVPVTLLQTNACSPLATNAIRNNIWDNFSSESYKTLPPVGTIKVWNPLSEWDRGQPRELDYELRGGGRGFTRVPSLISAWSTAPFLLNNSVGPFDPSPSVEARIRVFQASIEQMLWPERREKDVVFGTRTVPASGTSIARRPTAAIWVPEGYIPAVPAPAGRNRPPPVPVPLPRRRREDRADSQRRPTSLLGNVDARRRRITWRTAAASEGSAQAASRLSTT
jgi:hypothetical protein